MLFSHIKHTGNYLKSRLNIDKDTYTTALAFSLAAIVVMIPEMSLAQDTVVSQTICNIVEQLQGPVARGVAAFGIIFLGFSLFLGKISWGVALALGIGIGAIFGANEIVGLIGDGTDACV